MMQPIHIPSISDAELLAECAGACADFKLEELEHVDPRDPAVRAPKVRASGTIGTRPYVLELIVIPNAVIAGARTTAEARRSVLEGFYRTVKRAMGDELRREETQAAPRLRVYVASSWRNTVQPRVVEELRARGLDVYNYREPAPGVSGFSWSEIDPSWKAWGPKHYREALKHPIAARGYAYDINALRSCDVCVLVLPSGRSASWEFGYAMGQGKRGIVMMLDDAEPELMYREAEIVTSYAELHDAFDAIEDSPGMVNRPFTMSRDPHEATR